MSQAPDVSEADDDSRAEEPRRSFLAEVSAIAVGVVSGGFAAVVGCIVAWDPISRRKKVPVFFRESAAGGGANLIQVAKLDAVPDDGVPRRFPVITDLIDAWNFTPDVPIGAVYIRREPGATGDGGIHVYHSTCPHAGCSVSYRHHEDAEQAAFLCPCHNSSFNVDGTKRESGGVENPSPRPLDALDVELRGDEIWIDYKDYYTGIHEKKAKL
ncbi:MAG: Rieske 2Fe-2S domain-containing protein [Pirellulaceae bacterium]|jgi:menaquinol-cytochrome c reductase iron-sulfur subunit|nr:Rieske 2Fe-2S domain-containing protein [Pirellulaceae bacterium]